MSNLASSPSSNSKVVNTSSAEGPIAYIHEFTCISSLSLCNSDAILKRLNLLIHFSHSSGRLKSNPSGGIIFVAITVVVYGLTKTVNLRASLHFSLRYPKFALNSVVVLLFPAVLFFLRLRGIYTSCTMLYQLKSFT